MSDALTLQLDALAGSHVSLREAQAVAADLGLPRTRECTTTGALLDEDGAVVLHPEDTGRFDLDALRHRLGARVTTGTTLRLVAPREDQDVAREAHGTPRPGRTRIYLALLVVDHETHLTAHRSHREACETIAECTWTLRGKAQPDLPLGSPQWWDATLDEIAPSKITEASVHSLDTLSLAVSPHGATPI